jgi:hypothetical protein
MTGLDAAKKHEFPGVGRSVKACVHSLWNTIGVKTAPKRNLCYTAAAFVALV